VRASSLEWHDADLRAEGPSFRAAKLLTRDEGPTHGGLVGMSCQFALPD
jgi:hypothetical protein